MRRILTTHWGFDLGAWAVCEELSRRLDASLLGGAWSRLVIDLNRPPGDPTLARRMAGEVEIAWNRLLTAPALERRLALWHAPYHGELDRRIARHVLRGARPFLISVHSFTPELDGHRRPFDVGVLFREDKRPGRALAAAIGRHGLSVRLNQPYSGLEGLIYSVDRHSRHYGLPCLEIELNQALFTRPQAATRLGAVLADCLRELVATSVQTGVEGKAIGRAGSSAPRTRRGR